MNIIPIVFTINNNFVIPCGVTITSLLLNAFTDTFYDFYILHNIENLDKENIDKIRILSNSFPNCNISFKEVGKVFQDISIYEYLPVEAYYRILIPDIFSELKKIIYADVDMIFQQDLFSVFNSSIKNNELIGAVLDLQIVDNYYHDSTLPNKIGNTVYDYVNAGFLIMNLELMRKESLKEKFYQILKRNDKVNDQDVINTVCRKKIEFLPQEFNFQLSHFVNFYWGKTEVNDLPTFKELFSKGTLHYTGPNKPWNSLNCLCADTWWYYYKRSVFYNDKYYFEHQQSIHEAIRRDIKKTSIKKILLHLLSRLKHVIKYN